MSYTGRSNLPSTRERRTIPNIVESGTVLGGPTEHNNRSPAPDMAIYGQYWTDRQTLIWPYMADVCAICRT